MDVPDADRKTLEDDLKNLRTINRYFGGISALQNAVLPMVMKRVNGDVTTILDLATGSGDHPAALARIFRRLGKPVRITAVDRNDVMLSVARRQASGAGEIVFERGDILNLKYEAGSFDIVTCSLAIHHFSRDNAIHILREMNRISRLGFVVNDLSRSYAGALTAWLYTRLTTRNPMTRYDSVASVLRAFTKEELSAMAVEAGVDPIRIYTAPLFRLVAVKVK